MRILRDGTIPEGDHDAARLAGIPADPAVAAEVSRLNAERAAAEEKMHNATVARILAERLAADKRNAAEREYWKR